MRTKVNVIFVLMLAAIPWRSFAIHAHVADSIQLPLQLFTSFDGAFSIKTPAAFTEKVDTIDTALGKLVYHTFYCVAAATDADNQVYMVNYCDYPVGALPKDSTALIKAFFEATVEEAASSVRGDIIYAADTDIQGYPGKIWRISYLNEKAVIKTKACLADNRYYAVQVATQKEKSLNNLADRFLDSFYIFPPETTKRQ